MKKNSKISSQSPVTNAFTVDVEGFVESNVQSFQIPTNYISQSEENREIRVNTDALLEILDETNVKATFFFLGRVGRDIPELVKKVARAGHEVACHSYLHLRIFGMEKNAFRENLSAAKRDLEDISAQRVYGFRAPDFSITESSTWALDVLKETGFVYDSSIYPFGLHDVYGIKDANPSIHKLPNGLIEFPLSTAKLLGRTIPFAGGGYFRLYPILLTKILLSRRNKQGQPVMFYIHPYEVGPVIPSISELSLYRKFRHYYHCHNGDKRLKRLLQAFEFMPAIDVLRHGGWLNT